jgi:hypothetical protein
MFDVDKMLYFVAPEWWRPRLHRSRQQIPEQNQGGAAAIAGISDPIVRRGLLQWTQTGPAAPVNPLASSTVGWGGVDDKTRDNYFITDESEPAKFGSSLGWLLQLDGDNMRNAFLNAPWVKAVIPIRPGQEEAALNWLKGVEGMNGITDDVIYHTNNPDERDLEGNPTDGQKMIDVLRNLARKVRMKYEDGVRTGKYPKPSDVSDPALVDDENTVTSTPIDRLRDFRSVDRDPAHRSDRARRGQVRPQDRAPVVAGGLAWRYSEFALRIYGRMNTSCSRTSSITSRRR